MNYISKQYARENGVDTVRMTRTTVSEEAEDIWETGKVRPCHFISWPCSFGKLVFFQNAHDGSAALEAELMLTIAYAGADRFLSVTDLPFAHVAFIDEHDGHFITNTRMQAESLLRGALTL